MGRDGYTEFRTLPPSDFRIKHVAFDADNVVALDAVIGIATHIIVGPDEQYVTHAFGNPNGWDFAHVGNHDFIKAKAANSDTNLVIVTDKHSYNFILHFIGDTSTTDRDGKQTVQDIQSPWSMKAATLQVQFTYPHEIAAAKAATARKAAVERKFDRKGGYHNLNYMMSATDNDRAIAPKNVWDDGPFTNFKFGTHTERPNVYTINGDGSETLVNRHMLPSDAHVIVAERVAPEFLLRLGDDVVGVYNGSYDKNDPPDGNPSRSNGCRSRLQAAIFSFRAGVTPPWPAFGRSLF